MIYCYGNLPPPIEQNRAQTFCFVDCGFNFCELEQHTNVALNELNKRWTKNKTQHFSFRCHFQDFS